MRWVLFACIVSLTAGSASAQGRAPAVAPSSNDRIAALQAPLSAFEGVIAHPSAVLSALPDGDVLGGAADAANPELTAWRRLRDFLVCGGALLSLALLMLVWRFRTPRDEIDSIRKALAAEGHGVDSVRRRGGLTCRAAGGAHRTYDVVLRGSDGADQFLIVGVQARGFRPGALAEFDRDGRFLRIARAASPSANPARDHDTSSPRTGSIAA